MDSNVTLGNGVGIVTAIGMDTSIGKIAEVIQEEKGETPLQKKMDKLGKTLSVIAIIACSFNIDISFGNATTDQIQCNCPQTAFSRNFRFMYCYLQ